MDDAERETGNTDDDLADVENVVTGLDVDVVLVIKVTPDDVALVVAVGEIIDELEVDSIKDEVLDDTVVRFEDVMAMEIDGELVEVTLLEGTKVMLDLATELVVGVKEVMIGAGADDELLKFNELDTGVTKLELAPELVAMDENLADIVELVTTFVLVGMLEVLRYVEVLPPEAEDRIDELVVETFMLDIATGVLVRSGVVLVARNKAELEVDEVFAAADVVAIELVVRVPFVMELEVTGATELELVVVEVALGTTQDTNRAPQTLLWLTAGSTTPFI